MKLSIYTTLHLQPYCVHSVYYWITLVSGTMVQSTRISSVYLLWCCVARRHSNILRFTVKRACLPSAEWDLSSARSIQPWGIGLHCVTTAEGFCCVKHAEVTHLHFRNSAYFLLSWCHSRVLLFLWQEVEERQEMHKSFRWDSLSAWPDLIIAYAREG